MKRKMKLISGLIGLALAAIIGSANIALAQQFPNSAPNILSDLAPNITQNLLQNLLQNKETSFAKQNCLNDKQIQQAVINKKILPLNIVIAKAGIAKSTKILPPIFVCNIDGKLFYQFSILQKNGKAAKLILPATSPVL